MSRRYLIFLFFIFNLNAIEKPLITVGNIAEDYSIEWWKVTEGMRIDSLDMDIDEKNGEVYIVWKNYSDNKLYVARISEGVEYIFTMPLRGLGKILESVFPGTLEYIEYMEEILNTCSIKVESVTGRIYVLRYPRRILKISRAESSYVGEDRFIDLGLGTSKGFGLFLFEGKFYILCSDIAANYFSILWALFSGGHGEINRDIAYLVMCDISDEKVLKKVKISEYSMLMDGFMDRDGGIHIVWREEGFFVLVPKIYYGFYDGKKDKICNKFKVFEGKGIEILKLAVDSMKNIHIVWSVKDDGVYYCRIDGKNRRKKIFKIFDIEDREVKPNFAKVSIAVDNRDKVHIVVGCFEDICYFIVDKDDFKSYRIKGDKEKYAEVKILTDERGDVYIGWLSSKYTRDSYYGRIRYIKLKPISGYKK